MKILLQPSDPWLVNSNACPVGEQVACCENGWPLIRLVNGPSFDLIIFGLSNAWNRNHPCGSLSHLVMQASLLTDHDLRASFTSLFSSHIWTKWNQEVLEITQENLPLLPPQNFQSNFVDTGWSRNNLYFAVLVRGLRLWELHESYSLFTAGWHWLNLCRDSWSFIHVPSPPHALAAVNPWPHNPYYGRNLQATMN